MREAVAGVLAALLLAGCASPSPTLRPTPPTFLASVDTPDGRVGLTFDKGVTALYSVGVDHGVTLITTKQESGRRPTVHLSTYGGETGLAYNTFVFGVAPTGASRFELASATDALGGDVIEGVFLVALPAKDVSPIQLGWTFFAADGSVMERGTGIRD